MQIKKPLIIILVLLYSSNVIATITMYNNVTYYGDNLTVTFADTQILDYFQIGNGYAVFNTTNITTTNTVSINVSYAASNYYDAAKGDLIFRFNASNSARYGFDTNLTNARFQVGSTYYSSTSGGKITFTASGDIAVYLDCIYPDPPYHGVSSFHKKPTVNLTWIDGNYSDSNMLRFKGDEYPNSATDGTLAQNNTNSYYNFSVNQSSYFNVWSYNNTFRCYSLSALEIPWGALSMQCRNESQPWQNISYGVLISSSDGTSTYQTYYNTDNIGRQYINLTDIPYGDDTVFLINSSGFQDRTYYYDLALNNYYNLTFYLPPLVTEVDPGAGDTGGEDHNITTRLYYFQVLNEYNQPIGGATVDIQRYMNSTDSYETVAVLVTDEAGYNHVNLIPKELYQCNISATGFISSRADWIPDPDYYGIYYPKIFYLDYDEEGQNITTFVDIINVEGELHANNTIQVSYYDAEQRTTDVTFYIFEEYNGTQTQITSNTYTDDDVYFWETVTNSSRRHAIRIHLNHSILGYEVAWIYVDPYREKTTEAEIEEKFQGPLGSFDLGWVKTFVIFLPCIIPLAIFGKDHTGLAIMISGMYLAFSSFFIDVGSTVAYITLGGIIITIGTALIVSKKGRRVI